MNNESACGSLHAFGYFANVLGRVKKQILLDRDARLFQSDPLRTALDGTAVTIRNCAVRQKGGNIRVESESPAGWRVEAENGVSAFVSGIEGSYVVRSATSEKLGDYQTFPGILREDKRSLGGFEDAFYYGDTAVEDLRGVCDIVRGLGRLSKEEIAQLQAFGRRGVQFVDLSVFSTVWKRNLYLTDLDTSLRCGCAHLG